MTVEQLMNRLYELVDRGSLSPSADIIAEFEIVVECDACDTEEVETYSLMIEDIDIDGSSINELKLILED